ncbi:MAG: hypothetical protein KC414_14240, partial [Romboutsia sp.]|nr:hypothetical protein [Romboutsia sp.]
KNEVWKNNIFEMDKNKGHVFIFYILSTTIDRAENYRGKIIDLFSKVIWYEDNSIEFSYNTKFSKNIDKITISNRFFKSLEHLNFSYEDKSAYGKIKGVYKINNVDFNRAVFADMISNDPIFSTIFFANDEGKIEGSEVNTYVPNKNILDKQNFTFYYLPKPGKKYVSNAVTVVLTPRYVKTAVGIIEKWIAIRLKHVPSLDVIDKFVHDFSYYFAYYKMMEPSIIKIYKKIYPPAVNLIKNYTTKLTKKKKSKTTGQRMRELKKLRPDIFRGPLGQRCTQQVRIAGDEEVKRIMNELDPTYLLRYPSSMENMKNIDIISTTTQNVPRESYDWYTCIDKDKNTRDDAYSDHIFPYLVKLDKQDKNEGDNNLKYLPCCGTRQKKIKLEGLGTSNTVLQYNKDIPTDRKGKLPPNVFRFFKSVTPKDYIRYGVEKSPSSFLHCIAYAFNLEVLTPIGQTKYRSIRTVEYKINGINTMRTNLSKLDNSFYAECLSNVETDIDSLRELVLDLDMYFDPRIFLRLCEDHFDCNIYLFIYDSQLYPQGSIITPYYFESYIHEKKNKKRTICILLRPYFDIYQCE